MMNMEDSLEMFSCKSSASSELLSAKTDAPSALIVDKEKHLAKEQQNAIEDVPSLQVYFSGRSYTRNIIGKEDRITHKKNITSGGTVSKLKSIKTSKNLYKDKLSDRISDLTSKFKISSLSFEAEAGLETDVKSDRSSCRTDVEEGHKTKVHDFVRKIEGQFGSMCSKTVPNKRLKVCELYEGNLPDPSSSSEDTDLTWRSCDKCHLEFNSRKSLANHVKTHPEVMVGKNSCVYCRIQTDDPKSLSSHLLCEHLYDVANFTCESCQVECFSADLFDKHQYSCHRKGDVSSLMCSVCDKVYYDNDIFEYHKKQQKQCHICCLTFCTTSQQFKAHKEKHTLHRYSCCHCGAKFITKASLTKHLDMEKSCAVKFEDKIENPLSESEDVLIKEDEDLLCEGKVDRDCDSIENDNCRLKGPPNTSNEKEKCLLCPAEFVHLKNLWRHVAVVHQKDIQGVDVQNLPAVKSHLCTICDKKFTRHSNLVSHMASHIDKTYSERDGKPQCTICQKTFQAKRYLVDHMRLHSDRTYMCQCCDRKFLRKSHLKLHMEIHSTTTKSYSCPYCEKCYMKKKDQIQHIRQKHSAPSSPSTGKDNVIVEGFPCSTCNKRFVTALKLRMHEISHTVSKPPYTCLECSRSFPSLNTLKRHYLVHWDVRPFTCSVCSKAFRHSQSLKRHMTTHTGEKPYSCQLCGKSFSLKGTLNCHMLIHTNQRSFVCYKCDGEFASKRKMKLHLCCVQSQENESAENISMSANQSYTSYTAIQSNGEIDDGNVDTSVPHIINNTLVNTIRQVTHLITDQGISSVNPVTDLVSETIANNMATVKKISSNEMVLRPESVGTSNMTEPSGNPSCSNILVNKKQTETANIYHDNSLLERSTDCSPNISNLQQTDVLSQAFAVMGDDLVQDCVNLNACSVLEAKPGMSIGPETTVYTFVRVEGEDPHPALLNIPTVSDTGMEENVTLQINLTDDCSEVFIIET